jgi:WASH complex subunit 7
MDIIICREMYFNDDGFAMGLSYCLAILKQTNKSQSLHWFDSLQDKHNADMKNFQDQQAVRCAHILAHCCPTLLLMMSNSCVCVCVCRAAKEKKRAERRKSTTSWFGSKKKSAEEEDDEDEHQDFEEVHSLQLTAKRIEATRRENDQLFYSMSGAAIFFKRTDVDI